MTYRGVVKNGVVELEDTARLADGTPVEVTPVTDNGDSLEQHPAFGIWRDRGDMQDPAAAARDLRRQLEHRDG